MTNGAGTSYEEDHTRCDRLRYSIWTNVPVMTVLLENPHSRNTAGASFTRGVIRAEGQRLPRSFISSGLPYSARRHDTTSQDQRGLSATRRDESKAKTSYYGSAEPVISDTALRFVVHPEYCK